tara:strand:- start:9670 stop:11058 length:1389 start_codon:yes stop_codon:yes gene_type:complete
MTTTVGDKREREEVAVGDTDVPAASSQKVAIAAPPVPTVFTSASKASVEKGAPKMRALFKLPESIVDGLVEQDNEADVVIALDVSPSMADALPMLKEAVEKLPEMLAGGSVIKKVNVAVGLFDHSAVMLEAGEVGGPHGYEPFGELTKVAALNIAQSLSVDKGHATNTSEMVELGMKELRRMRHERGRSNGYMQHLVFLTDGHPTAGISNLTALNNLVKDRIDHQQQGHAVGVHVLCLGNCIDHNVPKMLVKSTGGLVGHAKQASELPTEMERIFKCVLGSSMAFMLRIVEADAEGKPKEARYRRYGMLTKNHCETLFTLCVVSKATPGTHIAGTVCLAHSGIPDCSIMLKFVPDVDYIAEEPEEPRAEIKAMLDEERIQKEEKAKIREALARNDFQGASQISEAYTQVYEESGLHAAAARSSFRADRLTEMSTDTHALPSMGVDGASMTSDALTSQSYSQF